MEKTQQSLNQMYVYLAISKVNEIDKRLTGLPSHIIHTVTYHTDNDYVISSSWEKISSRNMGILSIDKWIEVL